MGLGLSALPHCCPGLPRALRKHFPGFQPTSMTVSQVLPQQGLASPGFLLLAVELLSRNSLQSSFSECCWEVSPCPQPQMDRLWWPSWAPSAPADSRPQSSWQSCAAPWQWQHHRALGDRELLSSV